MTSCLFVTLHRCFAITVRRDATVCSCITSPCIAVTPLYCCHHVCLNHHVSPCVTLFPCVSPGVTVCRCVSPCVAVCHRVSLCVTVCHCVPVCRQVDPGPPVMVFCEYCGKEFASHYLRTHQVSDPTVKRSGPAALWRLAGRVTGH